MAHTSSQRKALIAVAIAVTAVAVFTGGIVGSVSPGEEDDTLWQSWQTMQNASPYTKWKQQNPGENTKLVAYWNNGGTAPTLATLFGQSLVLEAEAYWSLKGTTPPPPPPDTTAPTVQFTAPADNPPGGYTVVPKVISMAATATDNVDVESVSFYFGSNLAGTDSTAPYTATYDASAFADGFKGQITTTARDAAGNVSTEDLIYVELQASAPPPPPPPPADWTLCAQEHEFCAFSGTAEVRYGSGSTFFTRTATDGIQCDNATFGDPLPGIDKHCDFRAVQASTGTLKYRPPGWNGGDPTLASSFPGYVPVDATGSGAQQLNLDNGTNYYVNLGTKSWSSCCTPRSVGLHINGGNNVVVVGGAFNFTGTNSTDDATGVLVDGGNPSGTVYLEGLSVKVANGITIRTKRKVVIQNSRIEVSAFNDQHGNIHPDLVQVWGTNVTDHAPSAGIFMFNVTAYTTYTGLSMLVEISPATAGTQTDALVWERENVDIHPKQNLNGTFDAGSYFYHSDSPTGCNGGPYTDYSGEVYAELPTGGGGGYTRGIDDISVGRGFCPSGDLNFPYEIHTPDGATVFTSATLPVGGCGCAVAKAAGNYLTFARVPDFAAQRLYVGQPPTSKGAVVEGTGVAGQQRRVFVPSSVPGPNYVSSGYR